MRGTQQGPSYDEEIEKDRRRMELKQHSDMRMSKVAKMLTVNYYVTDWTHPCLTFQTHQLSVSEYYPELKIAVDKFYFPENIIKSEIEFKRATLKKQGIKYGFLSPTKNLADLYVELELGN